MLNKIFPEGIQLDEISIQLIEYRVQDIEKWIMDALLGQINHCKIEFMQEWIPKLQADQSIENIPNKIESLLKLVTSRPDYKNRKQRDEEILMNETSQFTVQ